LNEQSQLLPKDLLRPSPRNWKKLWVVPCRFALELVSNKYNAVMNKIPRTIITIVIFIEKDLTHQALRDAHALPQEPSTPFSSHFPPFSCIYSKDYSNIRLL
jgi:hypothetical protein